MRHLAKQRDASFFVLFFKTCQYGVLTLGQSMDPILKAMHNWGNQYLASHPEKRKTDKQPETDFAQKRP